jgi:glycogen debranching enzyme
LRRRVNAWGDLLRIRYGDKPSDSPKAWEFMRNYVQEMATLFDGFRLDNCHGTQLNVAKYMIKQARLANPNIIIFAELFTDTE